MTQSVSERASAFRLADVTIGDREFDGFRSLIFEATGISLNAGKRQLVTARLGKRVRALGLSGFDAYYNLVRQASSSDERQHMINSITTNKTDFFREPHHFDMLAEVLAERRNPARIWSAGCSSGEEPYTIAMVARETLGERANAMQLIASDVDTEMLARVKAGVYAEDRMDGVDEIRRKRHFLRGRAAAAGHWQARESLRSLLDIRQINFVNSRWDIPSGLDVIFCRNVIIYFNRSTQEQVIGRFAQLLQPRGLLILGHSENLHWLSDVFEPLGNTVYRLRDNGLRRSTTRPTPARSLSAVANTPQRPATNPCPFPRAQRALASTLPMTRILAGDVFASREPTVVGTLLGSCVAVCLRDPVSGVGGMNHFMLPDGSGDDTARYGVHAMEILINRIMALGGDRLRLEAKLFGGSNVLQYDRQTISVGEQNVKFARAFLALENIPVRAERVGGDQPLEVLFETATGRVLLRTLPKTQQRATVEAERRYRLNAKPGKTDDITLFTDAA
ncbi:MAG: hypothetical protein H7Z40_21335 [Phycisphaerae bacterium]|nr:hypothetical protein [Gemmatimonadaceae bacterium]